MYYVEWTDVEEGSKTGKAMVAWAKNWGIAPLEWVGDTSVVRLGPIGRRNANRAGLSDPSWGPVFIISEDSKRVIGSAGV